MTISGLTASLQAYVVSLWYDFVVDSPLAVPKAVQLTLQYMTLGYVQVFHQIFFVHFVLIVKVNSLYFLMSTSVLK
jgi:hypothetical protein